MKVRESPTIHISPGQRVAVREVALLSELGVAERLSRVVASAAGIRKFAEAFYFVRVGFVRANFILGSRCPPHEAYWAPVARNLWEELGAGKTEAHNELYRRFLTSTGARREDDLIPPAFAVEFDRSWVDWVQTAPILEGLMSLALYEALDGPDYSTLHCVLQGCGRPSLDLKFFAVHAEARHEELFDDFIGYTEAGRENQAVISAEEFVLSKQCLMWRGLLGHLEQEAA